MHCEPEPARVPPDGVRGAGVSPDTVILTLKTAVAAVTVLLVASLTALAAGRPRLHGRLNVAFFVLTMVAVLAFEVVIRFVVPGLTDRFSPEAKRALSLHLGFSVPSALLLPFMLFSGLRHSRYHVPLGVLFGLLWAGTFVTGIFYLPHDQP